MDYDETQVTFPELLDIFLCGVDPFDEGGQFIDRGHSYTLAVYYTETGEKTATEKAIAFIEEKTGRKAYISVEPFKSFYTAEEEHQDYYLKHPEEFEQELIESGRKKV